jgi:hypothetical protein
MSRIIYTNKQSLATDSSIQDKNKITSSDMNNIKLGINQSMSYAEGNTAEANKYFIGYSGTLTSGDMVNIKIPNNNYTGNATLSILGSTGEYKNIVYEDGTNVNCADIKNQYIQLYYDGTNYVYKKPTDLTGYVKNTDYATGSVAGVVRSASGFNVDSANGGTYASNLTYANYGTAGNTTFISKGTLENVITGKGLTTKAYVDGLVGDIATAIDEINGENV